MDRTGTADPPERPVPGAAPAPAPDTKDSQAVLRNAGWGMLAGLVQGVIRFTNSLLIARTLGAELLGVFHLSNRIAKAGTLFSLSGQDDAVIHFVARHRGTGDLPRARGAFQLSVAIGAGLSLVMSLLVFALAPWISRETFHNEEMVPVVRTLCLAVPLTVMGGIWTAGLRGTRNVKAALMTQAVLIPGSRLLLFVVLLLFGMKLFGLVWALIGSLAIGLFFAGYQLRRTADWMRAGIRPVYDMGAVIRFSLPLILLSLIDYANSSSDLLIVGHYHGAADAGVYGQAVRVLTFLKVPVSALSALFVPLCAELYAAGEHDRLRAMFRATASCGIRIAVPLVLGTVLFARPVMAMFGPEFVHGSTTLMILGTILVSNCFATLAGYAVYMSGRSWLVTLNQLFLAVASIGLYLALVPGLGIAGAALARAVAWALWAGLILVQTGKLFGFEPFSKDMLKGLVAGVVSFGAVWSLQRIDLVREHYLFIVLSGLLFLALYVGLVRRMGLTEDEKHILQKLGQKLRRRRRPRPA